MKTYSRARVKSSAMAVVDAAGKPLAAGVQIATVLRAKHKPIYTRTSTPAITWS